MVRLLQLGCADSVPRTSISLDIIFRRACRGEVGSRDRSRANFSPSQGGVLALIWNAAQLAADIAAAFLEPAQLDALLAGFGSVIDAAGGAFTMRYATLAFVAVRS